MRSTLLLGLLIISGALSDRAYGCDPFILERAGPERVAGVVLGYGSITHAVGKNLEVKNGATLRVRIDEVMNGKVGKGEAEVAWLMYAKDCRAHVYSRDQLEQRYPVGTPIVVTGVATASFTAPTAAIVAEYTQGGSVEIVQKPPKAK
jgi:hypothetical protein